MTYHGSRALPPAWPWRALAGLHAGVLAGLASLAWQMGLSALTGAGSTRTVLALAAAFYRSPNTTFGGWRTVLAGAAVHMVAAGIVGALFGITTGAVQSFRRKLLLGILFGVGWYHAWVVVLASPAREQFYSSAGLLAGYLLFGAILGASRVRLEKPDSRMEGLQTPAPAQRGNGTSSL